jgi:hypothetical protein
MRSRVNVSRRDDVSCAYSSHIPVYSRVSFDPAAETRAQAVRIVNIRRSTVAPLKMITVGAPERRSQFHRSIERRHRCCRQRVGPLRIVRHARKDKTYPLGRESRMDGQALAHYVARTGASPFGEPPGMSAAAL